MYVSEHLKWRILIAQALKSFHLDLKSVVYGKSVDLRQVSVRHDLRHVPELPQQGEVRHLETQTAAVHPDRAETARRHPARVRPPACPQAERLVDADRNRRGSARRRARKRDGAPRPENPRRLTLNRKRNRAARSLATRFSHAAERRGFEPLKPFRGLLAFQAGQFNHSCIFPKGAPKVHNISRFCK